MIGYSCSWCGGGHLGVDCPTHDRMRGDTVAHICLQYVVASRLRRHVERLRKLVRKHAIDRLALEQAAERACTWLHMRPSSQADLESLRAAILEGTGTE